MKSNTLAIYGINQHPSQIRRDFCWLDVPTLWELGYKLVAVSLFIAKKKKQHILTLRGVKAQPVCENNCVEKKDHKKQGLAKSKLTGMAP